MLLITDFSLFYPQPNRPEVMGIMKLVDALKYCIIKLRRGASCRSSSSDVLEVCSFFPLLPFVLFCIVDTF